MFDAAVAFDGWVSAILGGLVGAATVLIALRVTHKHDQRLRGEDAEAEKERARRSAGDLLIVEVANLRDRACRSKDGRRGQYDLWRLRMQLYTAQTVLHEYPSYQETLNFYGAVEAFRTWSREAARRSLTHDGPLMEECRRALDAYGDRLISMLQGHLTDKQARIAGRETLPEILQHSETRQ